MSVVYTAWHEIISGALRCRLAKDWCLYLQKSLVCHKVTHHAKHIASEHEISLDIRTAKIQLTGFKSDVLAGL